MQRYPGQVPSSDRIAALRLATERAKPFTIQERMRDTNTMMSTSSVLDGLGLGPTERAQWKHVLDDAMQQPHEVHMRKALWSQMHGERMDPALRSVLLQRSVNLYRNMFQKSFTQVYSPEALSKGQAATPVGGITPGGYKKIGPHTYTKVGSELHLHTKGPKQVKTGEFFYNAARSTAVEFMVEQAMEHAAVKTLEAFPEGHKLKARYKSFTKVSMGGRTVWTDGRSSWRSSQQMWKLMGRGPLDQAAPGWHPDRTKLTTQALQQVDSVLTKSETGVVVIVNLDELLSKAAAPKGGKYHRRVTKADGKHRYYYDPEKYAASKDAHVDGNEAAHSRIKEHVDEGLKGSGKKGYDVKGMKPLVKRYGSDRVGASLKKECSEGGSYQFKDGKLYGNEAKQPKEKS